MTTILYDGTFSGYLSSVIYVLKEKIQDVIIVKEQHHQPQFFEKVVNLENNLEQVQQLWTALKQKLSKDSLTNLYSCFLSELPEAEGLMLSFIKLVLKHPPNKQTDYGDATVLRIAQIGRYLFREKHRFEAFIRFQRLKDDLYYASIEPDYNVLPLIVKHFKSRYADQKWLIYDCKRKYGIYYDLITVNEVHMNLLSVNEIQDSVNEQCYHPEEELYQMLWKEYFKSVNISLRKNEKLHIQHMPKRYWKHLTEK